MTKLTLNKFEKMLKLVSFHYDIGTHKPKLERIYNKLDDLRPKATKEARSRIDEISREIEYFLRIKERDEDN